MHTTSKRDYIIGLVLIISWIILITFFTDPKDNLFLVPRVTLYGLIFVTIIWQVLKFIKEKKGLSLRSEKTINLLFIRRIVIVILITVGYIFTLLKFGFLVSTIVYFVIMALYLGSQSVWELLLGALGVTLILYLLFTKALNVILP